MSALERLQNGSDKLVTSNSSEATAIESARATAEVQAAVTVAQYNPRDIGRIRAEVAEVYSIKAVADQAFFKFPRGGQSVEGASIHMARELARIWGNTEFGVRELRRDDKAGESEILVYCWDQQKNVQSRRSIIVPHERSKRGGKREKLVDLTDINLNNNNTAARNLRECIFQVLPEWLKTEAESAAKHTMKNGDGAPLEQRIQEMLNAFSNYSVTETMIADKLDKARTAWDSGDLAELTIIYQSLYRGETNVTDHFDKPKSNTQQLLEGGK